MLRWLSRLFGSSDAVPQRMSEKRADAVFDAFEALCQRPILIHDASTLPHPPEVIAEALERQVELERAFEVRDATEAHSIEAQLIRLEVFQDKLKRFKPIAPEDREHVRMANSDYARARLLDEAEGKRSGEEGRAMAVMMEYEDLIQKYGGWGKRGDSPTSPS